jgi:hypothetical protein
MMLTDEGIVKVMDFGIARIAGSEHLTSDGFMMGTPAYMPPEQVLGQEADVRSDLYAMGVVLYRLWTGQLPFQGDTPIAIAHKQLNDPFLPLSVSCPDLPAWCGAILTRALAKDRADRFQTAQEFKAALTASASFIALDDVVTRTMQTPRGLPFDITSAGTQAAAAKAPTLVGAAAQTQNAPADAAQSRTSQTLERPPAAPGADPTSRTLVISARHAFAGVGAVVFVIILVAGGGFLAIRRTQLNTAFNRSGEASPPPAASPSPEAAPASSPASASPTGAPAAAGPPAAAPPATVPPNGAPLTPAPPQPRPSGSPSAAAVRPDGAALPKPGDAGAASSPAARGAKVPTDPASLASKRGNTPGTEGASAAGAPPAATPAAATAAALPAVTFDKLKLIVIEGDKAREQDAELQLADGRMVITDAEKRVIIAMPYGAVLGLSSSRSRQPRWRLLDGTVQDAKLPGGALGFIKSDRNWLGFLTQRGTYVFRVDDGRLDRLTQSATQRTGAPLVRVPK